MQRIFCTEMNAFAHPQVFYDEFCVLSMGVCKVPSFLKDFKKKVDKHFPKVYYATQKGNGVFEWKCSKTLFCFSIYNSTDQKAKASFMFPLMKGAFLFWFTQP